MCFLDDMADRIKENNQEREEHGFTLHLKDVEF
jgi:hypothetical protein